MTCSNESRLVNNWLITIGVTFITITSAIGWIKADLLFIILLWTIYTILMICFNWTSIKDKIKKKVMIK